MPKRTYNPSLKRKAKTHGFRKRMKTHCGRNVIKRRIIKRRKKIV